MPPDEPDWIQGTKGYNLKEVIMDKREMTSEEVASTYAHQLLNSLQEFGLMCDEVNASIITEDSDSITLRVVYESDSVMRRGVITASDEVFNFSKPLMSDDYLVPTQAED